MLIVVEAGAFEQIHDEGRGCSFNFHTSSSIWYYHPPFAKEEAEPQKMLMGLHGVESLETGGFPGSQAQSLYVTLRPGDTRGRGQGIQGLEKKDRASFTSSRCCAREFVQVPKS